MKDGIEPRKSIEERLKEKAVNKHGHTRCDLGVEVEESMKLKSSIEAEENLETKMKH